MISQYGIINYAGTLDNKIYSMGSNWDWRQNKPWAPVYTFSTKINSWLMIPR